MIQTEGHSGFQVAELAAAIVTSSLEGIGHHFLPLQESGDAVRQLHFPSGAAPGPGQMPEDLRGEKVAPDDTKIVFAAGGTYKLGKVLRVRGKRPAYRKAYAKAGRLLGRWTIDFAGVGVDGRDPVALGPQGMAGWWQVNGRSDKLMHEHTQEDLFYIQNYSLLLDLRIQPLLDAEDLQRLGVELQENRLHRTRLALLVATPGRPGAALPGRGGL